MKTLQHHRLHQLYELYSMRGEFVLITEFLAGVPLLERIANAHYEFNETVAVHLVTQLLEGLEFMHSEKIIHLDLCPQNIIFTTKRSNTLKICDFGNAHIHKPNEQFRHPYQNAEYKAPEIVSNDQVSVETDMCSLGVIVYMMLSGLSPFKGESDEETRNFVYDADFDFNHEVWKEVITTDAMDFISKLIVRERPLRMRAHHALTHKWLQPVYEEVNRKLYESKLVPLNCQRHRSLYNDAKKLIKEDDSSVCGLGNWAFGGSIRSLRGYSVAKIKCAPAVSGPKLKFMENVFIKEGDLAELICKVDQPEGDEKITWFKSSIRIEDDPDKYTMEYDGTTGIAKLYIMDIRKSDDSTYRCKV